MGSPCLFTRQQALKMGYFYWLRVKSSNHLHTELNLGYLKGTKFCLENTASFIDISSIASFKPFLIAWLREYCAFSDSSVANLKPYWKVRISYAEVLRHSFLAKNSLRQLESVLIRHMLHAVAPRHRSNI